MSRMTKNRDGSKFSQIVANYIFLRSSFLSSSFPHKTIGVSLHLFNLHMHSGLFIYLFSIFLVYGYVRRGL